MDTIDLGFRPRPWQLEALSSLKRFSVIIVHRGGGKTLGAVLKLIAAALKCKQRDGLFAYLAPELKQAKTAAWPYLRQYMAKIPGTRVNESELWVETPGGVKIRLFGADDPDALRGFHLLGVVCDEVAQMKPNVWGEILVPALAVYQGWAIFIGTPKGINLLSKLYFDGIDDPNWYAACFNVDATGIFSPEQLEEMRKSAHMSDQQFRQEFLCDFSASSDESLISIDLVREALGRQVREDAYRFAAKIVGVDVALGGADRSVIQKRQGLAAFPAQTLNYSDPQDIADTVALTLDAWQADACFIDDSGGFGSGVLSRLRQLGFEAVGVRGGNPAHNDRFQDRNAEMWWAVKEWLEQGGCLPRDNQYLVELTSRLYGFGNARGKLALEKKEHMKARGLKSPDLADALAFTFAAPVQPKVPRGTNVVFGTLSGPSRPIETFLQANTHVHVYDPFDRYAKEQERA